MTTDNTVARSTEAHINLKMHAIHEHLQCMLRDFYQDCTIFYLFNTACLIMAVFSDIVSPLLKPPHFTAALKVK